MGGKGIKIISGLVTIASLGLNIISGIVSDKQRKMDIAEEVKKAIGELNA